MSVLLIGLALLALALLGTPLFVIISAIALMAFAHADIDIAVVIGELYRLAKAPILLAIPLFTFAGYLMAESNSPRRLVNLSRALLGWMPGGLAVVALVSCAVFTAFTGASGVTIIALGGLLYPALLKEKYPEKFALGLLTSSGNIGLMLPPSLPIILYGLVSSVSIDQLFLAGVVPTAIMVVLLSAYSMVYIRDLHIPTTLFRWGNAWRAIKEAAWEIPLPFIILIGIYGGFFTATEAAAVTAFYALVVEVLVYKEVHPLRQLPKVMRESMVLVGGILVILGAAMSLANYMIDAEIPMTILAYMKQFITSKAMFLLMLNLFLLIVGALLDIFSAILVVVPILIPIAAEFHVDPVHLGIIFLTNLGIGYSTPPVGMNLFIASFRFNKSIPRLYAATIPFLLILLVALLIITYIPEISLFLVNTILGP